MRGGKVKSKGDKVRSTKCEDLEGAQEEKERGVQERSKLLEGEEKSNEKRR